MSKERWYDAELVAASMKKAGMMLTNPNPYFDNGAYWWHDETFWRHGPYPTEQMALKACHQHAEALNRFRRSRFQGFLDAISKILSRRPRA